MPTHQTVAAVANTEQYDHNKSPMYYSTEGNYHQYQNSGYYTIRKTEEIIDPNGVVVAKKCTYKTLELAVNEPNENTTTCTYNQWGEYQTGEQTEYNDQYI